MQKPAGLRSEPIMSDPSASGSIRAARATAEPPLEPYPLTAEAVGIWLGRRYSDKGLKSNLSNTKPLISALTHHARTVLGLSLDVRPYPGMELRERQKLHRISLALHEMEDMAARRSIPLTTLLLRMLLGERAVCPKPAAEARTAATTCPSGDGEFLS